MATSKSDIPPEVAAYMATKTVLLIGGDRRRTQLERLKSAFPLTRFIWNPTRQSDASLDSFRQVILRDDIDLVIVLHGLARTAHTKGTRGVCSAIHKPLLWCRRPTPAAIVRALSTQRRAA